ncbi:TetR/AcrR family transcriptional regulator [Nocardia sp. NPDC051570]|uniref:TetR/AcrR family transcriptional regulator n=1 Tax=Nocardia sp. NPDC051570 TaxID=3364324 RepID=UPI0037B70B79
MDTDLAGTPRRRKPRMPIEVRREEILDAALRLILDRGYAAASMEAIARAAALAKPRVYAAFSDRQSLLSALWQREAAHTLATLTGAMPSFDADREPEDILVAAFGNLLRSADERPDSWRLLLFPAEESSQDVQEHADATRAFARHQLRALLEWAHDRRSTLAETDLELASHALLAVGEQLTILHLTDPDQYPTDRCLAFADFTIRSLVPHLPG